MDRRAVLLMIICGSSIVKGICDYESVTAKCFCNSHIDIIEKVMLVEILSETCNCTISFLNNMDTPTQITNIFDRSCKWNCTSALCSKYQPLLIYNKLFMHFIESHSNFSLMSLPKMIKWIPPHKRGIIYPR